MIDRRNFFGSIFALLVAPFVIGRKNKINGLVCASDDLFQNSGKTITQIWNKANPRIASEPIHIRFTETLSGHTTMLTPNGDLLRRVMEKGKKTKYWKNGKRVKENPFGRDWQ